MKKFVVTKLTAIFAAAVLAAMPFAAYVSAADANVTIPEGYYVKEVKDSSGELVKGELTVSIPDGVTGNYNVKAYEILRQLQKMHIMKPVKPEKLCAMLQSFI